MKKTYTLVLIFASLFSFANFKPTTRSIANLAFANTSSKGMATGPDIAITCDGFYIDANNNGIVDIGDVITYMMIVTNTGDVNLQNVTVLSDNAMVEGGPIYLLEIGTTDSTTFIAYHLITQADIDAGQVGILATACGTLPDTTQICTDSTDPTPSICLPINPICTNCTVVCFNTPLLVTTTSTYNDFNNDGFVNVGDVINYQYSLTNNDTNPISNISLSSSTVTISGGTIATLNPGQTNNTTFTGTHVITQNEINTHTVFSNVTAIGTLNGITITTYNDNSFNLPVISDGILLNAFLDVNANGVQDSGETSGNYGYFVYAINGGSTNFTTASYPGTNVYLYETNPSNTYNLSLQPNNYYTSATTYSNVTVPTGSGITSYNFPVHYNPFTDLRVYLYNYSSPPIPGFTYTNVIRIDNNGTQNIPSGTLTFTKDANVTITNVNQTVTTTATGFTFNFTNLAPFESRFIIVTMQVPTIPTVALGQQLTDSVFTTIPSGDVLVSNNSSSLTQTIVGSYDPNDKQESHGGQIVHSTFTTNDYLTYTIRFENTGTANAINIKVDDLLDSKLDEGSILMVAASHSYVLHRNGSHLTWKFNGINLPPSNGSETIGHGYIVFQIKPKPDYAIGDIIPNTAEIYFDFNPAIVTNTCTTEFVETLSNDNFVFANLNYFPNPTKNSITISNDTVIDTIEITSILGQQILSQKINSLQTELDMRSLPSGIYLVKVTSGEATKTVKIVKE